ncbi:MAG: hypothetical protein KBG48_05490 [Kofleriaceae bacterium]|jgi:tetratricopeptide (TPR) repeat protein|nr:hypothetical protein [Kofleriaceae bacterium]MBP9166816.1 hypothetical protein [Kofleriaceae bacterium]MBP9857080.1 hypothetical protein [Kofleriaceae bacterium]
MRPILRTLLPLVALLVSAAVAVAQPDPLVEARAHYQAGTAKFAAAQYDEAVAEFRAADALAPSPMNDFNIGLALDRKGDAAGAVAAYRSYLNRSPNAANRGEVEASIARLASAAAAAEAAAAEAARQAAAEEAARRAAAEAAAAATRPAAPSTTGDPTLDRVATVDLAAARGAQPLPAPSAAATPPSPAGGDPAAPPPADQPKPKASKPIYKSPVFWVLAAVGVYVLITLADDGSDTQAGRLGLMEPVGSPRMTGGATVFSF